MTAETARIAVDIGGTFTDVVLEKDGARHAVKVQTTSAAPEEGVVEGLQAVLEATGTAAGETGLIIHGTTLATNAIIERKGACTALITTEGFRDVLEIGYEGRYDQYDIMLEKRPSLVPRHLRIPVAERIDIHGNVIAPLDEAGLAESARILEREEVGSVAIGFLHAYANGAHERRAGEVLVAALPGISISLSSEVCPEVREFERFTTTVANAYVRPAMAGYLGRLRDRMQAMGFACPVLLMTSSGGLTTLENAMRFPIRLVESGPAGGAILAGRIAAEMGLDRVISFDMGGTTAKVCLIEDSAPRTAREFEVDRASRFIRGSGMPLRIPVIEMVEIGAGGGSIARLDALKRIAVGPDSAGADPGPAAYGRGGGDPTVTDADIVLGRIDPERFSGGRVPLYPDRAEAAVEQKIATPLAMADTQVAAFGICEIVDETMANAARVHAVEQGRAASDCVLVAFGGAAPLHVGRLAAKLGIDTVIVPTDAGVGSAVGFLQSPISYEVVHSRHMRLNAFDPEVANEMMAAMDAEARALVASGAPGSEILEWRFAFMRYMGQGHEIAVDLPARPLKPEDMEAIREAFFVEYEARYRRRLPNAEIEILTWGLGVSTAVEAPAPLAESGTSATTGTVAVPPAEAVRPVFDGELREVVQIPVYMRETLAPGAAIAGPVLIVEDQTSTLVPGGFRARVTANGYLVLTRMAEEK